MRRVTPVGIALIERFEGCRLKVYKDAVGLDTIGIGHLIRKGEDFSKGITEDQARELLQRDLTATERTVLRLVNATLTDPQFNAVSSFTFNLGGAALQRSTLRMKLNRREYIAAARELLKWVYAGGRRLHGLELRRAAERLLYLSGTKQ